jgi:hypothetical protein
MSRHHNLVLQPATLAMQLSLRMVQQDMHRLFTEQHEQADINMYVLVSITLKIFFRMLAFKPGVQSQ